MTTFRIVSAALALALCTPAIAGEPAGAGTSPETREPATDQAPQSVPVHETLYLAETWDTGGPQAIVRTEERTEEAWLAIGRDLRARRATFPVMVAFFISEHAGPMPEGYPDCPPDQRQAYERWTLGTYVYQARRYEHNDTGQIVETVKQNVVTPRERRLNGVDTIELSAPDPEEMRNSPAPQRIVGVLAVVPGLEQDDLMRVAQAYEEEYGTPRLLQIVFFAEEPQWADAPFMTQGFYDHARRAYLRSSRAKDKERTEILPLTPRWVTLEEGQMVQD